MNPKTPRKYVEPGISCLGAVALALAAGCAAERGDAAMGEVAEPGPVALFNGVDLTGWDGDPRFWSVQDGVIVAEHTAEQPTERNTFLFYAGGEPANFELSFQIRVVALSDAPSANSGAQIRSERFTDPDNPDLIWRARGYQPDFAVSDWIPGIMHGEGGLGTRVYRGERVLLDSEGERHVVETFADAAALGEFIHLHTEWNEYRIYANGDTIRSWINGQLMHELVDESPDARHDGVIAFQLHTGQPMRIEFRDVYLTEF